MLFGSQTIERVRVDDAFRLFHDLFEIGRQCHSFGGHIAVSGFPKVVADGIIPKRLQSVSMMRIYKHINWNDKFEGPIEFLKQHNIKLLHTDYVPADSYHYYLIYTKDVNYVNLVMDQKSKENWEPEFIDLKPFYNKLGELWKNQA